MDSLKALSLEYLPDLPDSVQPMQAFVNHHKWQIGATVFIGCATWKLLRGKKQKLPPGPKGRQSLDEALGGNMKENVKKLHKEYGDIVFVKSYGKGIVLLMTHKVIKEAFAQRGFTFNHRPEQDLIGSRLMGGPDEVFFAPLNEEWTANKKFAAGALRKFSSKQNGAEEKIMSEMSVFLDFLRSQNGQPVDFNKRVLNVTANIIHLILFGERFDHEDDRLANFIELVTKFNKKLVESACRNDITAFFPAWLTSILYRTEAKETLDLGQKMNKFVSEKFYEHRDSFDPNNIRDFTDVYLNERLGNKDFNLQMTMSTIMIFLPDALEGIGLMVAIIMMYLAEKESSQRDIQEQIDIAMGNDKDVLLRHRSSMPKLDSFIMESFRLAPTFSATANHTNVEDTSLNGYDIPKHTHLIGMLENALSNEEDFPDPDVFNPDRFLDDDGKLVKTDLWLPFGMGRRMCMGEQLVKMEVFLILGNLLKNFTFRFEDENQSTAIEPVFVKRAPAYKLKFTPR